MREVSYTERKYRLLLGKHGWAWVFDDNQEVLDGRIFDDKELAMEWMQERTLGQYVKFIPKQ